MRNEKLEIKFLSPHFILKFLFPHFSSFILYFSIYNFTAHFCRRQILLLCNKLEMRNEKLEIKLLSPHFILKFLFPHFSSFILYFFYFTAHFCRRQILLLCNKCRCRLECNTSSTSRAGPPSPSGEGIFDFSFLISHFSLFIE